MMNAAGMQTQLKDGTMCTLRVEPTIVTRILTVLEFDELQAFIDNIARSVEELGIYTSSAFGETSVISRVLSCLRRVLTAVKPAKPEPIIVIFFIFFD
jgi:hypothetical protein